MLNERYLYYRFACSSSLSVSSCNEIQRRFICRLPKRRPKRLFSKMVTNKMTTSIYAGHLASTSTSQAKVTEYLNSISLKPLKLTASPEWLSSTLWLNQQTRLPNVNPTFAQTDVYLRCKDVIQSSQPKTCEVVVMVREMLAFVKIHFIQAWKDSPKSVL